MHRSLNDGGVATSIDAMTFNFTANTAVNAALDACWVEDGGFMLAGSRTRLFTTDGGAWSITDTGTEEQLTDGVRGPDARLVCGRYGLLISEP